MTITALPTPPTRSDPATFAARGDAFMTALPTFVAEANALAATVSADQATASTAASNASASQSAAASSASAASTSAATATTKASEASASASAASTSAANASNSAASASSSASAASTSAATATTKASEASASAAAASAIVLGVSTTLPVLRPTLNLNFASSQAVDPRITFTRASTATRYNAKGLVESVASGTPRIDYDPSTLACKGLLIEEARTNLLTYSEQFDNAAWVKSDVTVTANTATTAPDGSTNSVDKLVEAATTTGHLVKQLVTTTNTSPLTATVYAKAGERSSVVLQIQESTTFSRYAWVAFDLSAGTVGAVTSAGGAASSSASISTAGSGWYRCSVTTTLGGSDAGSQVCVWIGANLSTYLGDITKGLYIWGAQLEAGFATSYIPTTSAQVTRAADVATMTGTNFSSWYRQDEGSFVIEARGVQGLSPSLVATDDGTSSNRTILYTSGATIPTMRIVASGSEQIVSGSLGTVTVGAAFSVSFGYKINDCAGSVNGGVVASDATVTLPAGQTTLRIGANVSDSSQINGHIARLAYFPKRLTSAELQALSA